MKKVRPTVDKDLRDEIVNYCGGGSFNSALRHYLKAMSRHQKREALLDMDRKAEISKLKQEIAKLHNQKVKLEQWSSDVSQHNASLMDEIVGDRSRSIERTRLSQCRGAAIGLIVGLAIGYLFL